MESLALPSDVYGIANPKSTTGRLDIFTRLLTEPGDEFERVRRGYNGKLYIEVVSQTFPILVQAGMRLNQLRFGRGRLIAAGDAWLRQLDQDDPLIDAVEAGGADADKRVAVANIDRGLRLTVDLEGCGSDIVAYRANKFSPPIDLSKINHYDTADFWIPIYRNSRRQCILEPGEFYILASKQRVRVPPDLAAELLPYDLASQEFRVHYAGFFDPGFGYGRQGEIPGTRAVLEVRASQMPILLENDQFVGRLNYYRMAATPDKVYGGPIGSSYQQQGLALSKQFKRKQQDYSIRGRQWMRARRKGKMQRAGTARGLDGERQNAIEEDDRRNRSLGFAEMHAEAVVSARRVAKSKRPGVMSPDRPMER